MESRTERTKQSVRKDRKRTEMKKFLTGLLTLALLAVLVAFTTSSVMAGGPSQQKERQRGTIGEVGNSNVGFVLLVEKTGDWDVVVDGAWGKLKYNLAGPEFEYVFNGHGLDSEVGYSLIHYPEPRGTTWPWPVHVIDSGTANRGGNINLVGSIDLGMDLSNDPCGGGEPCPGAKIWLVLTDDISTDGELTGWNSTEYLFENNTIIYDDTNN